MQKLKGSCLCGKVSFEVGNRFDRMFICSCDQCRQITGSAFASNLSVAKDLFSWTSGADQIVTYRVPDRDITKSFCPSCGSGVPWAGGDASRMIVPAGSLSGEPDVADKIRIFTAEQPSWSTGLEDVAQHPRFPT